MSKPVAFKDCPRPDAVMGEKFIIVSGDYDIDRVVVLDENDGTLNPFFRFSDGEYRSRFAKSWCFLAPYGVIKEEEEEEGCSCEKLIFGVRPRLLLDADRMLELLEAMTRYADAGKSIPQEWLEELEELNASL